MGVLGQGVILEVYIKLWLNKGYAIQNLLRDIHTCICLQLKDHEI